LFVVLADAYLEPVLEKQVPFVVVKPNAARSPLRSREPVSICMVLRRGVSL
jgi:hypothetical protein